MNIVTAIRQLFGINLPTKPDYEGAFIALKGKTDADLDDDDVSELGAFFDEFQDFVSSPSDWLKKKSETGARRIIWERLAKTLGADITPRPQSAVGMNASAAEIFSNEEMMQSFDPSDLREFEELEESPPKIEGPKRLNPEPRAEPRIEKREVPPIVRPVDDKSAQPEVERVADVKTESQPVRTVEASKPDSKLADEAARERARIADEQARAQRMTEEEKRRADDEKAAREKVGPEKTSTAPTPTLIPVQAPAPESQSWLHMLDKVAANRQTLFDEVEAKQRLADKSVQARFRRAELDKAERLERDLEEARRRQARLEEDALERQRQAQLAAQERQQLRDEEKARRDEEAVFQAKQAREQEEREARKREADARFEEQKRQRDLEADKKRAEAEAEFDARERQRKRDEEARERARVADEEARAKRQAEEEKRHAEEEKAARKKAEEERETRYKQIEARAKDPQWAVPDIAIEILASDAYQTDRPFIIEIFRRIRSGDSAARGELDLWKRLLEQQASGCEGRENARAANHLKRMIEALEKQEDQADPSWFNANFVSGRWEEAA